jgi:putative peptidoglycan lipid II flippase
VALLAPSLAGCGFRFGLTTHLWTPAVRRMMLMSVPVAMSLGVLQLGVVLDKQIALMMSPQDPGETVGHFLGLSFRLPMELGALARLDWAQYLYQFPLGVFGIAIATAIFPQLSGDALDVDRAQFRSILARGIRASLFIGLPASVGMVLVALPAVRLLFERGQFTAHDSQLTALSTAIYSSVIWAFSVQQILNRAYYALHDMRTPLVWAILNLLINLVVEIPLLWLMGEAAMAVGTVASFLAQTIVMTLLLCRQLELPMGAFLPEGGKMLLASLLMIVPCGVLRWLVPWPDHHLGYAMELGSVMAAGGLTYFAACHLLRLPMESLLPARFRRR